MLSPVIVFPLHVYKLLMYPNGFQKEDGEMIRGTLRNAPLSLKLLVTLGLAGMAITYLILALHIYIDTQFNVSLIREAYSSFSWTELVDQTHKYFPYYGIYIFAFALFTFVLGTSYPEKVKIFFVIVPNLLIQMDIGSMWAIPYIHAVIFSWVLFFAGSLLALSFFSLLALIFYDIWMRKEERA